MENTKKDKTEFAKVLYGIEGNFGGKFSKNDLSLRFEVLKEYSVGQIKKAGIWLIKNREKTFPTLPTAKEFIDAINRISGEIEAKTKAEIEADKVLSKLKRFGRAAEPLFYDKTTLYLMTHRWTFDQLGEMPSLDLKWWRKNFVEAYQDIIGQEENTQKIIQKRSGDLSIPAKDIKKIVDLKKV